MMRFLLGFMVFLIAGTAVNVAVAWGCAWFDHNVGMHRQAIDPTEALVSWNRCVPSDWPHSGITAAITDSRNGMTLDNLGILREGQGEWSYTERRAGWPFRSMSMRFLSDNVGNDTVHGYWRVSRGKELPTDPLFVGFALNTAVYTLFISLIWLAIVSCVRHTVAQRRVQRNLCPYCSYPLGTSPVCTECGKAVPLRTGPRTRQL